MVLLSLTLSLGRVLNIPSYCSPYTYLQVDQKKSAVSYRIRFECHLSSKNSQREEL